MAPELAVEGRATMRSCKSAKSQLRIVGGGSGITAYVHAEQCTNHLDQLTSPVPGSM